MLTESPSRSPDSSPTEESKRIRANLLLDKFRRQAEKLNNRSTLERQSQPQQLRSIGVNFGILSRLGQGLENCRDHIVDKLSRASACKVTNIIEITMPFGDQRFLVHKSSVIVLERKFYHNLIMTIDSVQNIFRLSPNFDWRQVQSIIQSLLLERGARVIFW